MKKLLKFHVELFLTAIIMFEIALLSGHASLAKPTAVPAPALQVAAVITNEAVRNNAIAEDAAIPVTDDVYEMAAQIKDQETLATLAEQEAQRMIETGDVEQFREEIEKNSLLLSLMGY